MIPLRLVIDTNIIVSAALEPDPVKRLGNARGFIDLFWKGVLLVEQKSAAAE